MNSSHPLPVQHLHQAQRLRKDERELDVDEENWFNEDADEPKASVLNCGPVFNGGSDDEDSQPEMTGNSSAISTSEPSRSHQSLLDNDDDDALPIASADSTSSKSRFLEGTFLSQTLIFFLASIRSHYTKPVISIHIRRSPISSPSSSASTDHDLATARVDTFASAVGSPTSSSLRPTTPTESTSSYAMVREECL